MSASNVVYMSDRYPELLPHVFTFGTMHYYITADLTDNEMLTAADSDNAFAQGSEMFAALFGFDKGELPGIFENNAQEWLSITRNQICGYLTQQSIELMKEAMEHCEYHAFSADVLVWPQLSREHISDEEVCKRFRYYSRQAESELKAALEQPDPPTGLDLARTIVTNLSHLPGMSFRLTRDAAHSVSKEITELMRYIARTKCASESQSVCGGKH